MMTYTEMENYMNYRIIFMNFKIEEDGIIWGLQEGSRQQPLVAFHKFLEYGKFLNEAVELLEGYGKFLNDTDAKLLKKFKLYLKRFEATKIKLEALQPIENVIKNTLNDMINKGLEIKIDNELFSYDKSLECFIDTEFTYSKGEMYEVLENHFKGYDAPFKYHCDAVEHGFYG